MINITGQIDDIKNIRFLVKLEAYFFFVSNPFTPFFHSIVSFYSDCPDKSIGIYEVLKKIKG